MLIRDADDGLEVFMVRRNPNMVFAAGQYVFPGGRVDDADHADEFEPFCDGLDDPTASAILRIERGGLAYWVAAIRECFEEAGVLLARPATARVSGSAGTADDDVDLDTALRSAVRFDDPVAAERFGAARHRVHDGELSLATLCADEGLMLITDAIHYVSHWITPIGEARRFDTRFFVARSPQAQEPLHDDSETVASEWIRPTVALERFRAGELAMLPPTASNLAFLAPFETADAALAAAATIPPPPAILPRLRVDAEGRVIGIALPGEADYDSLA